MTERFFHDHIKVRQAVQFVHAWVICGNLEKLFAELCLDIGALSELVQTPGGGYARRFMASYDEAGNIVPQCLHDMYTTRILTLEPLVETINELIYCQEEQATHVQAPPRQSASGSPGCQSPCSL